MAKPTPDKIKQDRRKFIKKASYSVPVFLSLGALLKNRTANAGPPSDPNFSSQQQNNDSPN